MSQTSKMPKRLGSVQQSFVGLEAISENVLCLGTEDNRRYVGVLEVGGITYDLKSYSEQARLNELFRTILAGLTFDVQILWRSLPLRLEPYLNRFRARGGTTTIWDALAASHTQFLKDLAGEKDFLERRIYLLARVVKSSPPANGFFSLFSKARQVSPARALEEAREELDLRLSELLRRLELVQLSARRLVSLVELAQFYQSCLAPMQAALSPLPAEVLESVDRPVQVRRPGDPLTVPQALEMRESAAPRRTLFTQLSDLLAPSSIEVKETSLRIGEEYHTILRVTGLPRIVEAGWLRPLMELDLPFEVCFHLHPQDSVQMDRLFDKKRVQFQSNQSLAVKRGAVVDPHIQVAFDDVEELSRKVASGEERMLDLVLLIRVWGSSRKELLERERRLHNLLHGLRLTWHNASYEQAQAYRSCLPQVRSTLSGEGLLLSSEAVSTLFPFISSSLFHPDGILTGITPTRELVVINPWRFTNANMVIFGPSGQGKSHLVKTDLCRQFLLYGQGREEGELRNQVFVVDPDSEYGRVAQALGGQVIRLSPGSRDRINPFDLPQTPPERGEEAGDVLADHLQRLHNLLAIMLGQGDLSQEEHSLLDQALVDTYQRFGITRDLRTQSRRPPLLRDLAITLAQEHMQAKDKTLLLDRLRVFITGSLAGLFGGHTTLQADSPVVVFDTHECSTDISQTLSLFLISNFVWSRSFLSRIPRALIVDEVATLMQYPSGKKFLETITQRARKHYLRVVSITQHPATFQQTTLIDNSAIKVLMRPDPFSSNLIQDMFKLTERESQRLLQLEVGEGLLLVNSQRSEGVTGTNQRMVVRFAASEMEHVLATTDAREIARWMDDPAYQHIRDLLARLPQGSLHELIGVKL